MRELLFSVTKKDMRIDYFSGTGAGGQYRNKHQNCVRIRHEPSGVIVTGQSGRDRKGNEREAIRNLAKHPKFKVWQTAMAHAIMSNGKSLDQRVDEAMQEHNLKIEYGV